jgi:hypothetical protein
LAFESQLYFLSRKGIFLWYGDNPSRPVSLLLDPMFDPAVLAIDKLNKSWGYTFANRVGFALPEIGSTVPTLQIEYYPRLGPLTAFGTRLIGPWAFQRMPGSTFVRYRSGAIDHLFVSHNAANVFMRAFASVGQDNGVPFKAVIETGGYDFQQPARSKYIRRIRFLGRGRLIAQIKKDYKSSIYKTFIVDLNSTSDFWSVSDDWGSGTWGPDIVVQEAVVNADAYGVVFQLRLSDDETTIGRKVIEVGAREAVVDSGEWAVYNTLMEGNIMGIRS